MPVRSTSSGKGVGHGCGYERGEHPLLAPSIFLHEWALGHELPRIAVTGGQRQGWLQNQS